MESGVCFCFHDLAPLNTYIKAVFKFTPFLVKFTSFVHPILCILNFKSMFLYQFNYFCGQVLELCLDWSETPHLRPSTYSKWDLYLVVLVTLKFNLHIIGRVKKGCEFNQKRCEFKIFLYKKTINWCSVLQHLQFEDRGRTLYRTFVGPCPHRDRDYCIGSNFWKFHIRWTNFFGENV